MGDFDGVMVGLWLGCGILLLWGGWLSIKLNRFERGLNDFESSFADIEQGIVVIGGVLKQIPDMMPNFHLPQENPIQTLITMWMQNVNKNNDNITEPPRDDAGRYSDGTQIEQEATTQPK